MPTNGASWAQDETSRRKSRSLRSLWNALTNPSSKKRTQSEPKPERKKYVPRYAYRHAVSSFHPPPPVLPRDLRCIDSNFTMDRFAPRTMGGLVDGESPLGHPAFTFPENSSQEDYVGKGKAPASSGVSIQSNVDYLGAPLNANMDLAVRSMPQHGGHISASSDSIRDLNKPVVLSDGLQYDSPIAHAEGVAASSGGKVGSATAAQQIVRSRSLNKKFIRRAPNPFSTPEGSESSSESSIPRPAELQRRLSYAGQPLPQRTPGLHLAAQRYALLDKDQVYFRQGHVPERMRRSKLIVRGAALSTSDSSSSSSSPTPPYPSSSSSSSPGQSQSNSGDGKRSQSKSRNGSQKHSGSSSSGEESYASSDSRISTSVPDTIKEDSEEEARAEAAFPRRSTSGVSLVLPPVSDEEEPCSAVEELAQDAKTASEDPSTVTSSRNTDKALPPTPEAPVVSRAPERSAIPDTAQSSAAIASTTASSDAQNEEEHKAHSRQDSLIPRPPSISGPSTTMSPKPVPPKSTTTTPSAEVSPAKPRTKHRPTPIVIPGAFPTQEQTRPASLIPRSAPCSPKKMSPSPKRSRFTEDLSELPPTPKAPVPPPKDVRRSASLKAAEEGK